MLRCYKNKRATRAVTSSTLEEKRNLYVKTTRIPTLSAEQRHERSWFFRQVVRCLCAVVEVRSKGGMVRSNIHNGSFTDFAEFDLGIVQVLHSLSLQFFQVESSEKGPR